MEAFCSMQEFTYLLPVILKDLYIIIMQQLNSVLSDNNVKSDDSRNKQVSIPFVE